MTKIQRYYAPKDKRGIWWKWVEKNKKHLRSELNYHGCHNVNIVNVEIREVKP